MKRKIYLNKVSLSEARDEYLPLFADLLPVEKIKVSEALGRVTAEPIYARNSAPDFPASAMDGIAVRAEATAGASEREPVSLKSGSQAYPVDTGDPVPEGFNAVIKIEEVHLTGDGYYEIEKGVTPWHNVRNIGESVVRGKLVVPTNHKLTAPELGAIQEAGIAEIRVRRKAGIGIIPTGSELIDPEEDPEEGQLVEFNSTMLKALTEKWGAEANISPTIDDNYDQLKEQFLQVHGDNDLTVIIAGSSAGREDFTFQLLQELGRVVVHGVNIMPGKPVILAEVNEKPVIGLPGYPLAAVLNYYLFVRELIYSMYGSPAPGDRQIEAVVKRKVPSGAGLKEFIRVNLAEIAGEMVAVPRTRGSSSMDSLINADGILTVSESKEGLPAGSKASVYLLTSLPGLRKNLLLTGSDDLALDIIRNFLAERKADFNLRIQSVGSMGGLMALKRGETHLAGSHLLDGETGLYNKPYIRKYFKPENVIIIGLIKREQGLIVNRGNPKNITSFSDLADDDVVFINRQRGAGTRVLLDYNLQQNGIDPGDICGYSREEYTHINAAAAVKGGTADVTLGIKAAATALDLDFMPLVEEKYDLILYRDLFTEERIQLIIEIIRDKRFKKEVQALGGYNTDYSGNIDRVKKGKGDE